MVHRVLQSAPAALLALLALSCGGEAFTASGSGGTAAGGSAGQGGTAGVGGGSGGVGAAGAGGSACGEGTVSGIVDDFSDGVVDPDWTVYGSIAAESGGEAVVTLTPNLASQAGGFRSAAKLIYEGCTALIALQQPPTSDAPVDAYLAIGSGTQATFVRLGTMQGDLRALVRVDGVTVFEEHQTYDSAQHGWFRLRETEGVTHFETSPDGKAWQMHWEFETPSVLASGRLDFGAYSWSSHPSPGQARFDNVNRPPP